MARANANQVLGIALLRGRLYARVFDDGRVVAAWEYPDLVAGLQGLEDVLEEMDQTLSFRGSSVVVAISSSQVAHHSLKIPPMGEKDLLAYLERKAKIESEGSDRPCWGWRPLRESLKGERSVLLQVLPEAMVDVFLRWCDRRGHEIELVMPVSGSLILAAAQLRMPADSWALMAGEAEGATTVILVQPGGDLALVRELPYGWSDPASVERIGRELHRSLLFSKQQFGVVGEQVWLVGPGADQVLPAMEKLVEVPVHALSSSDQAERWLAPLVDAPWTLPDNLVPRPRLRLRAQRKLLLAGFLLAAGLAVAAGLVWTAFFRAERALARDVEARALESRNAALLHERDSLLILLEHRTTWLAQSQALDSACRRPLPGWVHGWLGRSLPPQIQLTRTEVAIDTQHGGWLLRLDGAGPRDPVQASKLFQELEARLASGVPGWQTRQSWKVRWQQGLQLGGNLPSDTIGSPLRIEGRAP